MKTRICFVVLLVTLLGVGVAHSQNWTYNGNPLDNPAYTPITGEAADNTVNFTDLNGNPRDENTGTAITETVQPIYGLMTTNVPSNTKLTTTRGIPVSWEVELRNEGNATFDYSFTFEGTEDLGAESWEFEVMLATNEAALASPVAGSLADDEYISYLLRVTPSTEASESPNLAVGTLEVWFHPGGNYPAAGTLEGAASYIFYYPGAGGSEFGGIVSTVEGSYTAKINTPAFTLTRVATVDSPDGSAWAHYPVPGSLYIITMTYSNTGYDTAYDVVIVDEVPLFPSMEAYKANVAEPESNVVITASQGDATGWTVYYTTEGSATVDKTYGGGSWVSLGALTVGTEEYTIPTTATFVKWEKASVADTEDSKTLQWSLSVR
jgi:hypothetical protein